MVMPLIDLADAKAELDITNDSVNDEIMLVVEAASEIINRECGYSAATQFTETVSGRADSSGRAMLVLSKTPVLSVLSVTPQMQGMPTVDITPLVINTDAGIVYLSNWWNWYGPVTVTYTAGRSEVPAALQKACRIIVKHLWRNQRGAMPLPPGGGDELSGAATEGLPYEALQLMRLSPYDALPGIA